ncbi:hypothetical protein EIN_085100 [Entamoeba invadens IP1]|uniref:hypothetical protein n=1 Tax=Entamoeba invadens IP1 TaxID=370355 RepID=UPI0002C3E0B7|nr:hypothetical protein EIN_085100 [Entamoeba invadens IP1]ELP85298.1 hypothetical protein EIN_085100 [Entamoeba invadens IP1]|eukprot:XP_004184644.1 hypothetical protein EIN_085100 [Entamoeba invadens IP1]
MSVVSTALQFSLVAKILQKVCSMLNEPYTLIVLLSLQSSNQFKTEKSISEELSMPLSKVSTSLQVLKEERLIESVTMTDRVGEKKKIISAYYINYQSAIENIVFKYSKIMNELNESRKVEEAMYICKNTWKETNKDRKCNKKYTQEEAIEYMDYATGRLVCVECALPLDNDVEDCSSQANAKLKNVTEQFKEVRELLDRLKDEYHSVEDYPHYTLPHQADQQNAQGHGKKKQLIARHQNYQSGIISGFTTRILDGPMPWEDDEEEVVFDTVRSSVKLGDDDRVDIFGNVVFLQNEFMKPDESFNRTETSIVPGSLHNSPSIPMSFKMTKKSKKQNCSRSVSAVPSQF